MSVFAGLIGQADVGEVLQRAASGDGMTPSWLFVGAAGSGRSVAARAFAAALECTTPEQEPGSAAGCGHCHGCTTVLAGTHADLTVVRPEGLSIGVAEARTLVLGSSMRPTTGRHRILLLEDADRLTEPAGNALLKALEEPAERTVFLLCAPAVDDVLPTVRSRCRVVRLRPPSSADVATVLRREGVDASMAVFAARAAQGHVGRARRLATDEQARARRAEVLRLPSRLTTVASCLAAAADLVEAAEEEAGGLTHDRDVTETAELQATLQGAGARRASVQVRGAAGALKDLEKRQRSRGRRSVLDALDRALVDLAAWYRDVLAQQLGVHDRSDAAPGVRSGDRAVEWVHDDQRREVLHEAASTSPEQTLRRLEAVLACRSALEETPGIAPLLAVEALALHLRTA
ncbi:MAG: polymerase subunit delta [Frankiaceae bacterium]|nr:polymerase subunit delta [Frankiaceae bacterium]